MVFYCTRCGARLQSRDDWSDTARVRCGSCRGITRTPDPGHDLPVAALAEPEPFPASFLDEVAGPMRLDDTARTSAFPTTDDGVDEGSWELSSENDVPFANAVPLDYATPVEPPFIEAVDQLAEKLANVQVAEDDGGSMHECPHCGSRITTYARKCPFCRHPLLGP